MVASLLQYRGYRFCEYGELEKEISWIREMRVIRHGRNISTSPLISDMFFLA